MLHPLKLQAEAVQLTPYKSINYAFDRNVIIFQDVAIKDSGRLCPVYTYTHLFHFA